MPVDMTITNKIYLHFQPHFMRVVIVWLFSADKDTAKIRTLTVKTARGNASAEAYQPCQTKFLFLYLVIKPEEKG